MRLTPDQMYGLNRQQLYGYIVGAVEALDPRAAAIIRSYVRGLREEAAASRRALAKYQRSNSGGTHDQ